jgi:hypothetical protein
LARFLAGPELAGTLRQIGHIRAFDVFRRDGGRTIA